MSYVAHLPCSIMGKTFRGKRFKFLRLNDIAVEHVTVRAQANPFHGFCGELFANLFLSSVWAFEDEDQVRELYWRINPGDIVLDIGAAIGSYGLPAMAHGAFVYSFCLPPDNYLLEENVSINGWQSQHCYVPYGILARRGFIHDRDMSFHSAAGPGRTEVRTLADFLDEHKEVDRIDWIKMDIEGAEVAVLESAIEIIDKFKPQLLVECHHTGVEYTTQQVANTIRQACPDYRGSFCMREGGGPAMYAHFFIPGRHV